MEIKLSLKVEDLNNLMVFLQRITLKGTEVPNYNKIMAVLQKTMEQYNKQKDKIQTHLKFNLHVDVINVLLDFLNRVELVGKEVPSFSIIMKDIIDIINEINEINETKKLENEE